MPRATTTRALCLFAAILCSLPILHADEKSASKHAEAAADKIVLISYFDRHGEVAGQGTGFIVGSDGLIATNLHVIGEARPIEVTFHDGTTAPVLSVHASDERFDLAILRVERRQLEALPLAPPDALSPGDPVIALGHPMGLTNSVATGVFSAKREIEGSPMLQLAMPIETGNSGGPVLGHDGMVHGIVTAKSLITPNLGFAVEAAALKRLLDRPNPIPMRRWLTVGALDEAVWKPRLSGRWRQQPGRIIGVADPTAITSRSFCVWQVAEQAPPYEISCEVRLADESGAAGLLFALDDGNRHYGFYPSNGRLRLTRFDGPTVFTWNILREQEFPDYVRGGWNYLHVKVEAERIRCSVNGKEVFVEETGPLRTGRAGLVRFRDVAAEFRRFAIGDQVARGGIDPELAARVDAFVAEAKLPALQTYQPPTELAGDVRQTAQLLERHARAADARAEALRQLARRLRTNAVNQRIADLGKADDEKLDVLRIALLIGSLDHPDVEVTPHVEKLAHWAAELKKAATGPPADRYQRLNSYFFNELGFHGSRTNYYDRANSRMDQVVNDREGLPISLVILYQYLGAAIDLKIDGIGLPGHFVAGVRLADDDYRYVDVFDDGKELTREDLRDLVHDYTGLALTPDQLTPASRRQTLMRVLRNLVGAAESERDDAAILAYLNAMVAIDPDSTQDQWLRAAWLARRGFRTEALAALEALIEQNPDDLPRILMLRSLLQED